ncbi:hypothetical protein FOMPIDRAFT_1045152 [Fomitopsis schrenkii]|uniref:Uncharacterized protein n=1 Tax=Fomitopsis schrenkii TaxID=2126942 RepID=S8EPW5_FOMSC|nr:hypothetical protein FOMPIDRAFT_1045152 [Fomitopsis schrenkii]
MAQNGSPDTLNGFEDACAGLESFMEAYDKGPGHDIEKMPNSEEINCRTKNTVDMYWDQCVKPDREDWVDAVNGKQ